MEAQGTEPERRTAAAGPQYLLQKENPSSIDMLPVNARLPLEITGLYFLQVMRGDQENVGTVKLTDAQLIWTML